MTKRRPASGKPTASTPNIGATARETPGDAMPARQFAYEMAFDPRFEGQRWADVERELAAEYPAWLDRQQAGAGERQPWDEAKAAVREAWDAALDVEHAEADPASGQWDERAPGYRQMWGTLYGSGGGRWEDAEAGYRYADAMAADPRFTGRPWGDVAPGLEAGFPTWAASHGYRIREGENPWEGFREFIKHAWEQIRPHRRSA